MKQEEKLLLLKDLCARIPYGVRYKGDRGWPINPYQHTTSLCTILNSEEPLIYLRPMSSMTEEEEKELSIILNYEFYIDDDFALVAEDDRHRIRLELCEGYIDWLNEHHFDFRGLIEKGLALEAPEGMYKTEYANTI